MPLSPEERAKLSDIVHSSDVVLFMKGNKHFPQCGFSATVVGILDKLGAKYQTVNVLADQAVRDGIKEYSQWPTIPQLYVRGELVGGCDIVKEMFASGELQKVLGVAPPPPPKPPSITVTAGAAKAFLDAAGDAGEDVLRLEIDAGFKNDLYFGPPKPGDVEVTSSGVRILVDAETAPRAEGVTIDFVDAPGGGGFKITNPNEPPRVRALSAEELKAMRDRGESLEVFDVRPESERALAKLPFARPLDQEGIRHLASLPKEAKVVFHCHHGMRSRRAAEQAISEGFKAVYNLEGGIDAWSIAVDPSVNRY